MSGNGIDLGQISAMLQSLIQSQADMREEFRLKLNEHSSILNEHSRILGEHSRRFDAIDRRLDAIDRRFQDVDRQFAEMRAEIASYHASVVGHGILISEIDARLRRVEAHLNLPSAA